mmetsp:Transcript_22979/g.64564  ORF Transcript_22979/g.64564 Transcript_22979/m.64564 type:complete len:133 (+) Transcript_22979:86-484(+)
MANETGKETKDGGGGENEVTVLQSYTYSTFAPKNKEFQYEEVRIEIKSNGRALVMIRNRTEEDEIVMEYEGPYFRYGNDCELQAKTRTTTTFDVVLGAGEKMPPEDCDDTILFSIDESTKSASFADYTLSLR